MTLALTGTLNMLSSTIDWRDETARCVGVFRAEGAAALEVEYTVHLDSTILDLLAKAFLDAGVPVLRGSVAELPGVRLVGDTLKEYVPSRRRSPAFTATGAKIDRRTKAWKDMQRLPGNGNGEQA